MENRPKRWTVEYAPKAPKLATCTTCKKPIEKDVLRIGRTFAAPTFDGFRTIWNHANCFLHKQGQFQTLDDVKGVYDLRWGDQQKIYKYVGGLGQTFASVSGANDNNNEYAIQNAKAAARCKSCTKNIVKGEVRISHKSKFLHAKCFLEMGMWTNPMEKMPGWDTLTDQDKKSVQTIAEPYIHKSNQDSGRKSKKRKRDERKALPLEKQINASWKKQTNALWKIKDELHKHVKTKELREMLKANGQDAARRSDYVLRERCADGMLFGAIEKCKICGGGFEYSDGQYKCLGYISPCTKCAFSTDRNVRLKGKWKIPRKGHNEYLSEWFKSQKEKKPQRILSPQSSKNQSENEITKEQSFLKGFRAAIIGLPNKTHMDWKKKLEEAGGKVLDSLGKLTEVANCLVTNESEIDKNMSEIENALIMQLPVLKESFLVDCLKKKSWLPVQKYEIDKKFLESASANVKRRAREPVHVTSGLQGTGDILHEGNSFYNITLNKCDLSININRYYILQVIVTMNDKKAVYHVFRKWDRVGNNRGIRHKLEPAESKSRAIRRFEQLFHTHTGHKWEMWVNIVNREKTELDNKVNFEKTKPDNKDHFPMKTGKYLPLNLDYQAHEPPQLDMRSLGAKSKLDPRVIELMNILFDPETYREAMKQLDIRLPIMPLGKLSIRNIEEGYNALKLVEKTIKLKESGSLRKSKLVDASNRFFTVIPTVHPRVIETEEDLKSKTRMLEALEDIERASKLLSFENKGDDPFDAKYNDLKCNISPLPHSGSDYRLIERYLKKTHAPTHTKWVLELEDAYKIDRVGECDAYNLYKSNLKNCMLLWHGSRTTNYVGILSRGLRIAPPEAPTTGYKFGKGIYLADLGSKSAKFCCTNEENPIGFMLLTEVALGKVYEIHKKKYMEKLPRRKHSTKGVGRYKYLTEYEQWGDDVIVPCGGIDPKSDIPPKDDLKETLKYNEYIVYETGQVKLQFLLKVRFHFKNL